MGLSNANHMRLGLSNLWEYIGGSVLMRAVCTTEEQLLGEKNIVSLFGKRME